MKESLEALFAAVPEGGRPTIAAEAVVRSRRAVGCKTMEGGGGSGNKTTGGLAGFFGAGGAGYSHADLAGVPRKYGAQLAVASDRLLACGVPCSLFGWCSRSAVSVVSRANASLEPWIPERLSAVDLDSGDVPRFLPLYPSLVSSLSSHTCPCAMGCVWPSVKRRAQLCTDVRSK